MSKSKVLRALRLMVLGKLLVLTNLSYASDIANPRFFEYRGGPVLTELVNLSFGWFKTLDEEQKSAYSLSITHAVMYADNGQKTTWYKNDASGWAMPAVTWSTGNGYCRRIHIQAIAYNMEKFMTRTACLDNASGKWLWIRE
jgi:surface antigen